MADEVFGALALAVTIVQYVPYAMLTFRRKIRPHVFSYFIWAVSAAIVAAAQWAENGGPGMWAMALTAVMCGVIVVLSLRNGLGYISKFDVVTFVAALVAIPVWVVTESALFAVITITLVDLSAFYFSIAKAWAKPHDDSIQFYLLVLAQYILSMFAMREYNIATSLNPIVMLIMTLVLLSVLFFRRGRLSAA